MTVTAKTDPVDLAVGDHIVRDSPTVIGIDTEKRPVRNRLRIAEVPSFELPRRKSRSGLRTFWDGWRVLDIVVRDRVGGRQRHRTAATAS